MGKLVETALTVRPATLEDIDSVREVLKISWHAAYDEMLGDEKVAELIERWHSFDNLSRRIGLSGAQFLVALNEHTMIAVAFAKSEDDAIRLHQLYVLPDSQHLGAGTKLLNTIKSKYPEHSIIRLEVAVQNQSAIDFYLAKGFKITGRCEDCVEDDSGIPCYYMERQY